MNTPNPITFKFALGQRVKRNVGDGSITGTVISQSVGRDGTQGVWIEYLRNGCEVTEAYVTEAQGEAA